jgi:methionine-rich copper-binding protein CopC
LKEVELAKKLFLAAAAVFAIATGPVAIQMVSAHSRPVRLDPPPGSVLASAPATVTGWFTAEVRRDPNWTFVHVTDEQGNRVDTGEATLSADRKQMSVSLRSGLGPGRYLVTWRTYDDADGAIFGDCYAFFVGQAAADAAIGNNMRLDGGRDCQRIDVEAKDATPVAGGTPQGAAPAGEDEENAETSNSEDSDNGVPAWTVVLGAVGGLAVGGIGGRLIGRRG